MKEAGVGECCPRCRQPGRVTDPGGLLYACPTCAITFIPAGAVEVGLIQQTARSEAHLVVDRVPLSAAFIGRYQVSKLVGSGGMGTVYLAYDRISDRDVCVKFLYRVDDRELLVRFLREGKMLAQIHDPHVVELMEAGETRGFPYLVMEHVSGGTLRAMMSAPRRRSPVVAPDMNATLDLCMPVAFSVEEAVSWMRQILEGLSACHQRGIVHRDLKPENVLVTEDGVAKLSDLGIGKDLADTGTLLTRTGEIMGTPTYVSPEQIRGESTTPASDIYSFGVMAYELVSGSPPFVSLSLHDIIRWHKEESARPLREKMPEVPAALSDLISRCLAKEPSDRPKDAAACLEELARLHMPSPTRAARLRRAAVWLAIPALAGIGWWTLVRRAEAPVAVIGHVVTSSTSSASPGMRELAGPPYPVPASPDAAHRTWEDLDRQASISWDKGRHQEAETIYRKALAAAAGFRDLREVHTLHSYSIMLQQTSRMKEAEQRLLQALDILGKLPESAVTYSVEESLGHVYGALHRPADEDMHHRRALAVASKVFGTSSPEAVGSRVAIATCRLDQGRIDEARAMIDECLRTIDILENSDPASAAHALYSISNAYVQMGDDEAAERLCRRELGIHERLEGPEGDSVGETLRKLASFYHSQGRLAEASPLMLRALEITRKARGARTIEVVYCLESLAGLALGQGIGAAAVQHGMEMISILEEVGGEGTPRLPAAWMTVGQGHEQMHEEKKALACYRRALDLLGPGRGLEDPLRIELHTHRGPLELRHGNRAAGEESLDLASRGLTSVSLDPFRLARLAQRVATLQEQAGRTQAAIPAWERAVSAIDSLPGAPVGERVVALIGLGRALLIAKQEAKAQPHLDRAFLLWDQGGEGRHPYEIQALTGLGVHYLRAGQAEKAIACFEREGKAFRAIFDQDQISVVTSELNHASALQLLGRHADAITRFEALLARGDRLLALPQTLRVMLVRGYAQSLRDAGRQDDADRARGQLGWLVMPTGNQHGKNSPWRARLDRARTATLRAADSARPRGAKPK